MSRLMHKVWLGAVVGVAIFNAAAGVAVAADTTDDSGSGRVIGAGVMLLGAALIVWGLWLRGRRARPGNTLVALGAFPALLWFWYLVPAVAAIVVVIGSVLDTRHPDSDHVRPSRAPEST